MFDEREFEDALSKNTDDKDWIESKHVTRDDLPSHNAEGITRQDLFHLEENLFRLKRRATKKSLTANLLNRA